MGEKKQTNKAKHWVELNGSTPTQSEEAEQINNV